MQVDGDALVRVCRVHDADCSVRLQTVCRQLRQLLTVDLRNKVHIF